MERRLTVAAVHRLLEHRVIPFKWHTIIKIGKMDLYLHKYIYQLVAQYLSLSKLIILFHAIDVTISHTVLARCLQNGSIITVTSRPRAQPASSTQHLHQPPAVAKCQALILWLDMISPRASIYKAIWYLPVILAKRWSREIWVSNRPSLCILTGVSAALLRKFQSDIILTPSLTGLVTSSIYGMTFYRLE